MPTSFLPIKEGEPESPMGSLVAEAVEEGYHLTAIYEVLGQLVLKSEPGNVTFEVDGSPCDSPCVIDKDAGASMEQKKQEGYF